MRLGLHDRLEQRCRGRTDLAGLAQHASRRPLGITTMARRHVLRRCRVLVLEARAHVAGNALALVEQLDRGCGEAHVDGLAQQSIRRRVVVIVDLDVIVGRHRAALPLGILVALRRQCLQRRPVEADEQLVAALVEPLHHLGVDCRNTIPDSGVQLVEREEATVAQPAEHIAGDDTDRRLDLGFVTRLSYARRQHDEAVVVGELLVGSIDAGLVARRLSDARLEIIGHRGLRHAAEEVERVDVRADPVGQRLGPARLRIRIARRAESGDEQVRLVHLAGHRIDDGNRVASPIDEQLVTRQVRLPHDRRQPLPPLAVQLAEVRVAVAVGTFGAMLLPQDHQRDAAPLQLLVYLGPIGHWLGRAIVEAGRDEQPPLQIGVAQLGRHRPRDTDHLGAGDVLADCRLADTCRLAHLADAEPQLVRQPQHLADLPHRHSLAGHRPPRCFC